MDKIKKVVNSPLFMAGLAGITGIVLLLNGAVLYGGIAIGIGAIRFIDAFKKF